jgi:hypothetical protein
MALVVDFAADLLALLNGDLATETFFWTVLAVTLATLETFLAGIVILRERFYLKFM